MNTPNFIIVGAARSGTTSLYYYLREHPEIYFPNFKEPKFFSSFAVNFPQAGPGDQIIDKYIIKDWENYKKLFKPTNQKVIGEASPDYLYYHNITTSKIREYLGDVKIIIILRNPSVRAYSAYSYLKRENREDLDFETSLKLEEQRKQEGYDFMWHYKSYSYYYDKVKSFLEKFSNVKIVINEELESSPHKVYKQILQFLEVDDSYLPHSFDKHNISGTPQNIFAKFILNRQSSISTNLREFLKSLFPRPILERFAKRTLKTTSYKDYNLEQLNKEFIEDIEKLEELTKIDFKKWWI